MSRLPTVAALAVATACNGSNSLRDAQRNQAATDVRPIEVTAFPADPAVTEHILSMQFEEAAARLGSLDFTARSHFDLSRGGEEMEQNDIYKLTQDSRSNFHVLLDTPASSIEVFLVDEVVYVRYDKGHLRSKPRRDVETEAWRELAFGSWQQALSLFRKQLGLSDPTPEMVGGRQATRYTLSLVDPKQRVAWSAERNPMSRLPVAMPARWRELARPLDLQGSLSVDAASGVVSRVVLNGRIEIADRAVRPTQLSVRYESTITDVGRVATVKPPKSVPEFRRAERPSDLLSFFRDHLDEPAPNGAASPGAGTGTAKPARPASKAAPDGDTPPDEQP